MNKTRYGHDIEVLKQAADLCREGGCESAIPFIVKRINWLKENDYEK